MFFDSSHGNVIASSTETFTQLAQITVALKQNDFLYATLKRTIQIDDTGMVSSPPHLFKLFFIADHPRTPSPSPLFPDISCPVGCQFYLIIDVCELGHCDLSTRKILHAYDVSSEDDFHANCKAGQVEKKTGYCSVWRMFVVLQSLDKHFLVLFRTKGSSDKNSNKNTNKSAKSDFKMSVLPMMRSFACVVLSAVTLRLNLKLEVTSYPENAITKVVTITITADNNSQSALTTKALPAPLNQEVSFSQQTINLDDFPNTIRYDLKDQDGCLLKHIFAKTVLHCTSLRLFHFLVLKSGQLLASGNEDFNQLAEIAISLKFKDTDGNQFSRAVVTRTAQISDNKGGRIFLSCNATFASFFFAE